MGFSPLLPFRPCPSLFVIFRDIAAQMPRTDRDATTRLVSYSIAIGN